MHFVYVGIFVMSSIVWPKFALEASSAISVGSKAVSIEVMFTVPLFLYVSIENTFEPTEIALEASSWLPSVSARRSTT